MKTRARFLAILLLLCTISFTAPAIAKDALATTKEARVMEMKQRVDEIRSMDFSHMNKLQRREVKSELKNMKTELKQMDPTYIYVSGGALLLIIIILILIL